MAKYFAVVIMSALLCSCASKKDAFESSLYEYSQANCLYWYFESKGYDTKDIRSISGGIVEMSGESIDKFQKISIFVKGYRPNMKTKNNIDVDLYKCFHLKDSEELNSIIEG
ncbi:hypothetical protein [Thalassolituus oleivorans]|uniref:hypothetical protein n=1 Tax=Thalassolituus oleivorans TaxID=187493 RepID=UPI0023F566FF|nr:hypothetical protein [Thalassolituus oleivorans]